MYMLCPLNLWPWPLDQPCVLDEKLPTQSRKKRSPIWNYFTVAEDTTYGKCNSCSTLVSRGGNSAKNYNTTNLVSHLKTDQKTLHDEYEAKRREANTREACFETTVLVESQERGEFGYWCPDVTILQWTGIIWTHTVHHRAALWEITQSLKVLTPLNENIHIGHCGGETTQETRHDNLHFQCSYPFHTPPTQHFGFPKGGNHVYIYCWLWIY